MNTFRSYKSEIAVGFIRCAGYSTKQGRKEFFRRTRGGTAIIRPLSVFADRGFFICKKRCLINGGNRNDNLRRS